MKKVLIIAYHYPPLGGSGVFRTLKFTKYLPRFGFKPYVLTVKNAMYQAKDPTLLEDIPNEVEIFRTFSIEHKIFLMPFYALKTTPKWIFVPDINIGWLPFAVRQGERIIKKENINVIYATAPIFTSLLIGCLLKRKTGKPLVIDFRDPWTQNVFTKYPTRLHKKIEEKMEERVLKEADYIIVAGDYLKHVLTERYPFVKSKMEVITNGFDPDDFKDLKMRKQTEKFRIIHTGSIYGLLTARPFLLALSKAIEEKTNLKEKLEVMFVGSYGNETSILVHKLGLNDVVKLVKYTPHKKCLELMLNSHLLLLLIALKDYEGTGILTGKLFEYLASRIPILAIAPENGAAANIIRPLKAGVVVSPDNIELIKETIFKFYEMWEQGKLSKITGNITRYDRVFLTQQLAQIFDLFAKV